MMTRTKVIIVLLIIQVLAIAHIVINNSYPVELFPLSDVQMSVRGFVWRLFNRINYILFYYVIYKTSKLELKPVLRWFLAIEIFVIIEFILNYNDPWFFGFGITHISILIKSFILYRLIVNKI